MALLIMVKECSASGVKARGDKGSESPFRMLLSGRSASVGSFKYGRSH